MTLSDSDTERNLPTRRLPRSPAHTSLQNEPHPEPPSHDPGGSGLYVPWWGFALVVLMVAALTCGLWGYVLFSRPDATAPLNSTPTPVILVITPTPTIGVEPLVDTPQTIPTLTHTIEELPPAEPENMIALGGMVTVGGTEGSGVAIRQGPGTAYQWMAIGNEGDVFLVQDGPRENNGYTWWFIVDPQNADRAGWAAGEFLQAVEE